MILRNLLHLFTEQQNVPDVPRDAKEFAQARDRQAAAVQELDAVSDVLGNLVERMKGPSPKKKRSKA